MSSFNFQNLNQNNQNSNRINLVNVQQITQALENLNKQVQDLTQQINSNQVIENGLEQISKFQVKPGEDNIPNKQKQFLNYRNTIRRLHGLNTSNYVVCKICKQVNVHYTNYCPKLLCGICLENGHSTRNCKLRFTCQICNSSSHPTMSCKENNANEIRAMANRVCFLCKAKGHIAKDCGQKGSGLIRNRSQVNYGYGNRGAYRGNRFRRGLRGTRGGSRGFRGRYKRY